MRKDAAVLLVFLGLCTLMLTGGCQRPADVSPEPSDIAAHSAGPPEQPSPPPPAIETLKDQEDPSEPEADTDGDGLLSKDELQARLGGEGGGRGRPWGRPRGRMGDGAEYFQRLDADGDGKLSRDEVPEPVRERIFRADADGDGQITQEELAKGREQMRRRFRGERG